MRSWAFAFALVLLAPALAGCASKAPPAPQTSAQDGGVSSAAFVPDTPRPKPMSERWHFHDYWKGSPLITLLSSDIELNATMDDTGAHVLSTVFTLPQTVIVPAETGFLLVNVTWGPPANATSAIPAGGELNLTFRPSDSNDYFGAGNVTNGKAARINTTESMCDVPHRQETLWRWNLSAVAPPSAPTVPPMLPGLPGTQAPPPAGAPSKTVHVTITATIGRPLFIDPPHLNWWQGSEILPIVAKGAGDIALTTTNPVNVTLPRDPQGAQPSSTQRPVRVPVDAGRIVPEGATSIVAILNWTSSVPGSKLVLGFAEGNNPSQGALTLAKDGATSRVFAMTVAPPQTDTTYSNRTTWEFHVKPDPASAQAFDGSFTLVAWATRLPVADAVRAVTG